jgi:DNA gyrase subunit A
MLLDDPDTTVERLIEAIPGPDFPTGGTIVGREGIQAAYATGRGRVVIRAKAYVEEQDRGNRFQIVVTELPYQVNKAVLLERIAEQVRDGKLDGISNLRDESDRSGMRMVIELKRDAQPKKVLFNLYKHSALQQTFGINMLALVERGTQPRVLTLKRALQEYIGHRQEVITRRTEYDLERARRRAHVLEGLKIALDNIEAVIATIRRSRSTDSARRNLRSQFTLSEIQANAILDMRLARLAALERQRIEAEYKEVLENIAYLEGLLADPELIRGLIREDIAGLKEKYGDPRRTTITEGTGAMTEEDLIPEVDVLVTVTTKGYVKRLPQDTYRIQRRGGRGVTGLTMRDEDAPLHMIAANTHDYLLVFTNRGRCYQIKVHELPDASRQSKGIPIVNVISMQPDESVTTLLKVRDYSEAKYLFFTTRLGTVKRVDLDQFRVVRSNGLIAIGLDDKDELAWVRMTSGDDRVVLVSTDGQAIQFHENDVRAMGRPAAGVHGIKLGPQDRVIGFDVVAPDRDLLVVASRGLGKRTSLDQYPTQRRGGQGVRSMKLVNGDRIVAASMVSPDDGVVLMNNKGITIKFAADTIRLIGRSTQGVTLMRLGAGEEVVSMTVIQPSDPASTAHLNELEMAADGVQPES